MRSFRTNVAPILLLVLGAGSARSEEYNIDCPASVRSDDVRFASTPAGWNTAIQGPFWLHSAGPMDGPPAGLAVLKEGAIIKRSGKKTVVTWDLSGAFSKGKWMACNYGMANEFRLSKKLDDTTSACIVTSIEQASGKVDIAIRCQR